MVAAAGSVIYTHQAIADLQNKFDELKSNLAQMILQVDLLNQRTVDIDSIKSVIRKNIEGINHLHLHLGEMANRLISEEHYISLIEAVQELQTIISRRVLTDGEFLTKTVSMDGITSRGAGPVQMSPNKRGVTFAEKIENNPSGGPTPGATKDSMELNVNVQSVNGQKVIHATDLRQPTPQITAISQQSSINSLPQLPNQSLNLTSSNSNPQVQQHAPSTNLSNSHQSTSHSLTHPPIHPSTYPPTYTAQQSQPPQYLPPNMHLGSQPLPSNSLIQSQHPVSPYQGYGYPGYPPGYPPYPPYGGYPINYRPPVSPNRSVSGPVQTLSNSQSINLPPVSPQIASSTPLSVSSGSIPPSDTQTQRVSLDSNQPNQPINQSLTQIAPSSARPVTQANPLSTESDTDEVDRMLKLIEKG